MLRHLSIRNYAIAETLEIEFAPGMTAITGETGAGKSIILGAMSLILGDRADRDVVRSGADKTDISAEFDLSRLSDARQWLSDNELQGDDDVSCLIRRSVGSDGRSRAWVNGAQVTLQTLTSLGTLLMDIHSQHEHHSLLKKATHQVLLDNYAGIAAQSAELRNLAEQWKHTHRTLSTLQQQRQEQSAHLELIRYQLQELESLNLGEDELAGLDQELDELTHAEERLVSLQALIQLCKENDEGNLIQMLQRASHLLENCGQSPQVQTISDMLANALIQVEEASGEIQRLSDQMEINPERLEQVNQRLSEIHQMARKHKVRPEDLTGLHRDLRQQLQDHEVSDEDLGKLQKEAAQLQSRWQTLASTISTARTQAAVKLSAEVNKQLQALAMKEAELTIQLHANTSTEPQAAGLEHAEFLIRTNRGDTAKPLNRIASGGELSRVSLAIQVITALTSDTPTLVFDEVDVGIGGAVAKTVGRLLRQLGERSQIFCVTHQALVASQAHQHLQVSKHTHLDATLSQIQLLSDDERLLEIARMLGGEQDEAGTPSAESLAHARELRATA